MMCFTKLRIIFSSRLLLVFLIPSIYALADISEIKSRTLSDETTSQMCHSSANGALKVIHPNYCSRYIKCEYLKEPDEDGNYIQGIEKSCDKCDPKTLKSKCPYGFLNFDPETQSCVKPNKNDQCRQLELKRNNIWGEKSLAYMCEDSLIGVVSQYPHPNYCGAFVTCYKDSQFIGDIWVIVETCPSCNTEDPNCPKGAMHYKEALKSGSERSCQLPGLGEICTDKESSPFDKVSTNAPSPLEIEFNLENATKAAEEFCSKMEMVPKRYPDPSKCHHYFYCFPLLYDGNGDTRPMNEIKSYEFRCPYCWERDAKDNPKCPQTLKNEASFLYFDEDLEDCVIPRRGLCEKNGKMETSIPTRHEILLKEATDYCIQTETEQKKFANPKKCHSYFICWATLYNANGERRALELVMHFQFKCGMTLDKKYYRIYDNNQQKCVPPTGLEVCKSDGQMGIPEDPNVSILHWKLPLMSKKEVAIFCQEKNISGYYAHPQDKTCSRYVECWAEGNSFVERSCPACDSEFAKDKIKCPEGHLYYDPEASTCKLGASPTCEQKGPSGRTIISKSKTLEDDGNNEQVEEYSNTGIHHELLIAKHCDPDQFVQRGYCKYYFSCSKKTRREKRRRCSGPLYWNPDYGNKSHGGICSRIKSLTSFTLQLYQKDPDCPLHAPYFRRNEAEDCSGTYYYYHPTKTGKEMKLTCHEDLLWSKDLKTCVACTDVRRKDRITPCCGGDDDIDNFI